MNNKILSVILVAGIATTGFAGLSSAAGENTLMGKMFRGNSEMRQILEKVEAGETLTEEEQTLYDTFQEEKSARDKKMEQIKTLREKQESGETLTAEEQALLESMPERGPEKGEKAGFGKRSGFGNLTEQEKTALESMSDDEKKAFFEAKKSEMDEKRQAHKELMDALIAGKTLTSEQETLRAELVSELDSNNEGFGKRENAEIMEKLLKGETLTEQEKTELTQMQAKHAEREAKRQQLEAIQAKKEAGETLTAQEKALLESMPERPEGKHGKMRGEFSPEEEFSSDEEK